MKPDTFFPFYAVDFWQAVEGLPDCVITAYLRAITHYWCHTHCSGLRDDEVFLKRICRVDSAHWDEARAVVFDNARFFALGEDGLWHQKRAKALWAEADRNYQRKVNQTREARKRRWK